MVTSSGITIDGKVYRNLESQVAYNAEMIEQLLSQGGGGSGSGPASIAVTAEVTPSMWQTSPTLIGYYKYTIPFPSGITFANAIWCNPDRAYYKIKQDFIITNVITGTQGLDISIYTMTPPVNTYVFDILFFPAAGDPLANVALAFDVTNYTVEKEGYSFFDTISFSVSSWREVSSGVRSTVWNDSTFADIYLNYSDGYNIYLCPANATAQEFINKYRISLSDPLLTSTCTFIAWNAPSTPSSPTINFNVWTIPNGTGTSYIFLQ